MEQERLRGTRAVAKDVPPRRAIDRPALFVREQRIDGGPRGQLAVDEPGHQEMIERSAGQLAQLDQVDGAAARSTGRQRSVGERFRQHLGERGARKALFTEPDLGRRAREAGAGFLETAQRGLIAGQRGRDGALQQRPGIDWFRHPQPAVQSPPSQHLEQARAVLAQRGSLGQFAQRGNRPQYAYFRLRDVSSLLTVARSSR